MFLVSLLIAGCGASPPVAAEASRNSATGAAAAAAEIRIPTRTGQVVFRDSATCDVQECDRYTRLRELRERYVFIGASGAPAPRTYAVDRVTGEVRLLKGEPQFNPPGTIFVTSSLDEMEGTAESEGLFVWAFDDNGRMVVRHHVPPEELADVQVLSWAGDSCAVISGFRGWGTPRPPQPVRLSLGSENGRDWKVSTNNCAISEGE